MSTDEQSRAVRQLEQLQQRLKDDATGSGDIELLGSVNLSSVRSKRSTWRLFGFGCTTSIVV